MTSALIAQSYGEGPVGADRCDPSSAAIKVGEPEPASLDGDSRTGAIGARKAGINGKRTL